MACLKPLHSLRTASKRYKNTFSTSKQLFGFRNNVFHHQRSIYSLCFLNQYRKQGEGPSRCAHTSKIGRYDWSRSWRSLTTETTPPAGDTEKEKSLTELGPYEFVKFLKLKKISRCYIVFDKETGKAKASHPELQEIADFLEQDTLDYRQHEGVFFQVGIRTGCLLGTYIWKTSRGQAVGGIRLWKYSSMEKFIRDGLRLAFGMGAKAALAGLWSGGGKGVIAAPPDNKHMEPDFRQKLFYDYGDFITSLNGCFVGCGGVGISMHDLDRVRQRSRFVAAISPDTGGSGNPYYKSAKGVVCAMEGALDFLDLGTLAGKRVAIQGAGHVAGVIIEELLDRGVDHIYVTDCNQKQVEDIRDAFSNKSEGRLEVVKVPIDDNSVIGYPCDILSPCALGNVLNQDTIPNIQAKIVCGAANNQLGCEEDNQLLADQGVTYIVDFLANRMAIVNCANEAYGRLPLDPAIWRHFNKEWENSVFVMTKKILQKAKDENVTPAKAAFQIADKMSLELHPIWPNRGQQIIDSLVETKWETGTDFWRKRKNFAMIDE